MGVGYAIDITCRGEKKKIKALEKFLVNGEHPDLGKLDDEKYEELKNSLDTCSNVFYQSALFSKENNMHFEVEETDTDCEKIVNELVMQIYRMAFFEGIDFFIVGGTSVGDDYGTFYYIWEKGKQEDSGSWTDLSWERNTKLGEALIKKCKTWATSEGSVTVDDLWQRAHKSYENKDYVKALALFARLVKLQPDHDRAWYFSGYCNYFMDEFKEAIKCISKAIEYHPGKGQEPWEGCYYSDRGEMYLNCNDYEKSIADYRKALELNPNSEEVQKGLESALKRKEEEERPAVPLRRPKGASGPAMSCLGLNGLVT
jgi:tetratricopeptide (TPR) repeat protein